MDLESLLPYLNNWYGYLLGLFLVYEIVGAASNHIKAKKLGCKSPTHSRYDYFFGFSLAYNLIKLSKTGEMIDFQHDVYENMGCDTFVSRIVGNKAVITRHPDNIKAILATQFNDFELGIRHKAFLPLLGDGIFTLDAHGWKHSRAMLRPQFAREQVAHVKSLEPHIQNVAEHIRNHKGQQFDLQELFFKLTVDSATEFLFGQSCECLCDGTISKKPSSDIDEYLRSSFAYNFNNAQEYLMKRMILRGLGAFVWTKEYAKNCREVHEFTDFYVQKALNTPDSELEKLSMGGYVFLYELVKQTRDPKVLRDQCLNILLAGRDTTAGVLSFTFLELARNPKILQKLREEVVENFGDGDDAKLEEITFESLKKCEYLKAVINESLRLYPSVPRNARFATKDTSLPRGGGPDESSPIFIAKGTMVGYNVGSTHKHKFYYGQDADEYRPERWFEPSTRKLGWAYLPFNGGPRICLGQQFALTEASYVIVRLLQLFHNLEGFNEYPPKKNSNLTMMVQGKVKVVMT